MDVTIGLTAPDFARRLASLCQDVRLFTFVVYEPAPSLTERLQQAPAALETKVLEWAEEIRKLTGDTIPYWESVLAAAWASIRFEFFAAQAVKHDPDPNRERMFQLAPEELASGRLADEIRSLDALQVLALDSRCQTKSGAAAHLPLMDFRVLPLTPDVNKVALALRTIGQQRGSILLSGRSYHYYGYDPLTPAQWIEFSAKCLLLSPLTDSRYIAHRLLAGAGSLRLTASVQKPVVPTVVANL